MSFFATILAALSYITLVIGQCSETFSLNDKDSIFINNTGYPEAYSGKNSCSWTIKVPDGNFLSVYCNYNIPESKDCNQDVLFFGDKDYKGSQVCGNGKLNVLTFNTPGRLGFYSPADTSGGKFECSFDTAKSDDSDNCVCGWKPPTDGDKVYPFLAAILRKKELRGSATIISKWFAITSASAMIDAGKLPDLELAVGAQDKNYIVYHKIDKSLMHESYDDYTVKNNIAIIKTEVQMEFNDYVGVACLPYKYKNDQDNLPDEATVLGWTVRDMKEKKDNSVVATNVTLMSKKECEEILGEELQNVDQCTRKKEDNKNCKAQEGAPLIWEWNEPRQGYYFLYMFSWAGICTGEAMTTKIVEYLDWIDEKTEGEFICKME